MIDSAMVTRGGMDRAAPLAVWQAGLEQMVELRNGNKLTLPLKSHGYLLEIVASLAEKSAAKAEADLEEGRRKGQHRAAGSNGPDAGPRRADIARSERINRVGADLSLGLIDEAAALSALRAEGLSELAVQRLAEQHRRDA
ncbi:MAG: hypothetical protein HYV17_07865 [Xanthomonadales bacterium]|nr:hypothetical protein [Xanthomonadales bacterium]